jgi:phosphoglycolate phosphatase
MLNVLTPRDFPLAILSNKAHNFNKIVVPKLLPNWPSKGVLGARPSVPKKSDPARAFEIAAMLTIPPSQFLYLRDTGTDMKTDLASGMFPVGALYGFRPSEEIVANGAKVLIEKPIELFRYL